VRGQPVTSSVPALLFSGDQDPVTPPERAEEVAKHLANGRHAAGPSLLLKSVVAAKRPSDIVAPFCCLIAAR